MPCGQAPASDEFRGSRPAAQSRPRPRAPLQLEAPRGAAPPRGFVPSRPVPEFVYEGPVEVLPRAPRGPLLLGPGRIVPSYGDVQRAAARRLPTSVLSAQTRPSASLVAAPPPVQLTPFQREVIDSTVKPLSLMAIGFLPLRLDVHPDGRVRTVWVMTEVQGVDGPGDTPRPPVGSVYQSAILPERPQPFVMSDGKWFAPHGFEMGGVPLDLDPQWREAADLRWAVNVGRRSDETYHTTLEHDLDRSGFKQSAKLREVRRDHWRYVAQRLRARKPVAFEVLDDYPALAQFFAQNLAAAKTAAEVRAEREASDNPENPDITVHWSVQQGLLLYTRGKVPAIIDAIKAIRGRGMGFKWSGNLGAWYRPQSVGVSESTVDIDRVANALRKQGMVVAVERGDSGSLGDANTRRQDHKFWRAEGYAGRAETAVERASESEARAASIRADLPVGAATKQADRAEARAERLEGQAAEHLQYAVHATGVSQNLARTATGYDTTAAITRKEAEKRSDRFSELFTRKIKGLTGAVKLQLDKKDNLSEYSLRWDVFYPPTAGLSARVLFDGRVVRVVAFRKGEKSNEALKDEVSHAPVEEVFQRVVDAMPKYVADATALAPTDPHTFGTELSLYAAKRTAQITKAIQKPYRGTVSVWKAGDRYGNGWRPMEMHEGALTRDDSGRFRWTLAPLEGRGLVFKLSRAEQTGPYYQTSPRGSVELDFTGLSIADAWELLLAGVRAVDTNTPLVAPKPKGRAGRGPNTSEGRGTVASLAREFDATAAGREQELRDRVAPVARAAASRLEQLREIALASEAGAELRDDARSLGKSGGFYPTPPTLAAYVVDLARVQPGEKVLEPSAGMGALVEPLVARGAAVTAIEVSPERAAYLEHVWAPKGVRVGTGDFLAMQPTSPQVPYGGFDVVVMNPPFSTEGRRYTDAEHVAHALSFLRPGGRLVAIMAPGSQGQTVGRRKTLHDLLEGWSASWESVNDKRFRISGTDTPTVILTAVAPQNAGVPTPEDVVDRVASTMNARLKAEGARGTFRSIMRAQILKRESTVEQLIHNLVLVDGPQFFAPYAPTDARIVEAMRAHIL